MVLNLRDFGVVRARNTQPALQGKKVNGRGTFSAVFDGASPDRVLKLTLDAMHYAYMTDGLAPEGVHKPDVFEDFGEVGETQAGDSIYLIEVERLTSLPRASEARRMLTRVMRRFTESGYQELPTEPSEVKGLSESFAEFLAQLNWFSANFLCSIDAKVGDNFMQRDDGTVVASDPVFDKKMLKKYCFRRQSNSIGYR